MGAVAFVHSNAARPLDAPRRPVIGFLGITSAGASGRYFTSFRDELARLGHIANKTVVIDYRDSEGDLERIPSIVQELMQSRVDVLVLTSLVAVRAAQRATTTIPIVISLAIDPVAAGFAKSFRQPGGNITGVYTLRTHLAAKRIELVHEMIPGLSRIAILWDPDGPGPRQRFEEYSSAAKAKRLEVQSLEFNARSTDLEGVIRAARSNRAQALVVISNPFIGTLSKRVAAIAEQNGLPSIGESSRYSDEGGLFSYSDDLVEQAKMMANIVGKVLKGTKPASLPIEQPTKFELVINIKTAKALGIAIPQTVLVRADRVIQ